MRKHKDLLVEKLLLVPEPVADEEPSSEEVELDEDDIAALMTIEKPKDHPKSQSKNLAYSESTPTSNSPKATPQGQSDPRNFGFIGTTLSDKACYPASNATTVAAGSDLGDSFSQQPIVTPTPHSNKRNNRNAARHTSATPSKQLARSLEMAALSDMHANDTEP